MPTTSVLTVLRMEAIADLKSLARNLEQLVLEPQAGLTDADLAALVAHRDALLGVICMNQTRGHRALAPAEVISNLAYDAFADRSAAQDLLRRIEHHLSLLVRLYGPQVKE